MPVYFLVLFFYTLLIRIASVFSEKARLWVSGRKNVSGEIESFVKINPQNRIWIHCASLGEFEQGRPLIEKIKQHHPHFKVVLSFFSPSGYEVRKNYEFADLVLYLPADIGGNASQFVDLLQPSAVIFVKYEFWLGYLSAIQKRKIPLFLISAVFRPNQIFFKFYGGIFKRALAGFNKIFVQDPASETLLLNNGYKEVVCCGDTRIDRVTQIAAQPIEFPKIEQFKGDGNLFIAGSTWPADLECVLPAMREQMLQDSKLRFLIAPHDISASSIQHTLQSVSKIFPNETVTCYTNEIHPSSRILILDTMGMLSMVYSYGNWAYVGGGFGDGIHSILEPAAFHLPILFGPKHQKFKEASEMIRNGLAFEVENTSECIECIRKITPTEVTNEIHKKSKEYLDKHRGATDKIYDYLNNSVFNTFKG